MQLQFLGATQTVTGSKYLLSTANKKILIDCGLFQGLKELRLRNWDKLSVEPSSIDAVILTHAHIDHSGYIPLLIRNGFSGKIYCTKATQDLCKILLLDSGHLQEEEARRANRYGYSKHKPALPLYTRDEAEKSLAYFTALEFNKDYVVAGDFNVCFNSAGHILGAANLLIRHQNTSILFSGDIGRPNDPCIFPPAPIVSAEYLVVESTYGDRLHENVDVAEEIKTVVNRTIKRGGCVIIPAFAVGRAQSVLYYLYSLKKQKKISDVPIYFDSPMATEVTKVMFDHISEHRLSPEEGLAACSAAHYINSVDESKSIDNLDPKIIISANGMATGGRVLHHIKYYAPNSLNTILFSGYQAAGTRGDIMLRGTKQVKMFGELVPINAEVVALNNISAHADYQEILAWLRNMPKPPRKVFVTHGEPHAADALKIKIEETLNWQAVTPKYLETVELE